MCARPHKHRLHRVTILLALSFAQIAMGQTGATKRVRFAKGHTSATYKGAVVRGTRDRYLVGAKAGQLMTVRIRSAEQNAVFSVADPAGAFMNGAGEEDDATRWSGKLPSSGDFAIEVGGTRGNADYSLTVIVK
ncbi:MAG: hypothetical protein ACJ746_22165 [Bryobacteraceae bacterium]